MQFCVLETWNLTYGSTVQQLPLVTVRVGFGFPENRTKGGAIVNTVS